MTDENDAAVPSSRRDFEQDVIRRTREDPEFRTALLADPKAALQSAYGMEIPPDIDIEVLQESGSKFYIVLPFEPAELTDEQLGAVAGGAGMEVAMKAPFFTAAQLRMR